MGPIYERAIKAGLKILVYEGDVDACGLQTSNRDPNQRSEVYTEHARLAVAKDTREGAHLPMPKHNIQHDTLYLQYLITV